MASVVSIETSKGLTFDDVLSKLRRTKKITGDIIEFFCSLYLRQKELESQKKELGLEIKDALLPANKSVEKLRGQTFSMGSVNYPMMLSVTVTDPQPKDVTDWDQVSKQMARKLYGKNYKDNPDYKALVESATEERCSEPQVRLNEPSMNPEYKGV